MDDGPDPAQDGPAEEPLQNTVQEGISVELLVHAGRNHSAPAWEDDVEDEENNVHGWLHLDDGLFARANCFGSFNFSFVYHL